MNSTSPLFAQDPEAPAQAGADEVQKPKPPPRVLWPNRKQLELRPSDLDSLLPDGHRARLVWGYVEQQNLAGLYAGIKAVEGGVGRSPAAF